MKEIQLRFKINENNSLKSIDIIENTTDIPSGEDLLKMCAEAIIFTCENNESLQSLLSKIKFNL